MSGIMPYLAALGGSVFMGCAGIVWTVLAARRNRIETDAFLARIRAKENPPETVRYVLDGIE